MVGLTALDPPYTYTWTGESLKGQPRGLCFSIPEFRGNDCLPSAHYAEA
jgi:hypothetical protein